jgi:hypothetical protein
MLRLDRTQRTFRRLSSKPLKSAGVLERTDLQRMIVQSPEPFCQEIGETLLLLGEEVVPTDVVDDRIDVLALDKQGSIVVVELKRGANKLHLLQALSYAAMASEWDKDQIIGRRAAFKGCPPGEAEDEIEEFLDEDISALNEHQRVLLLAEEYDYQVLATAKWLGDKHEVDVACWQMELADDAGAEYLSFACVYPPVELAEVARSRGKGREAKPNRFANWDAALDAVKNPAVVQFYKERLAEKNQNRLRRRALVFNIGSRNRFVMHARRMHAYVWQRGRFEDDIQFWRDRLGQKARIDPVADGRALRIFLETKQQFDAFWQAFGQEVSSKTFVHEPLTGADPEESLEEDATQAA